MNRTRSEAQRILDSCSLPPFESGNAAPVYDDDDKESVLRVLQGESVWRSNSEASTRLCRTFRRVVNPSQYQIPLSSGTAAIHTALTYYVRSRGPYVLIPSYTWYSAAAAVLNSGGVPLFWDLGPNSVTLNPEPPCLPDGPESVACCLVSHLFGLPIINKDQIEWLRTQNIPIVEDCAQCALGTVAELSVGQIGDVATYSFNGSKHIPAGEGGILVTDNADVYAFTTNFVMTVDIPTKIEVRRFNDASEGWNYRLGSIHASLAESLTKKLRKRASDISVQGQRFSDRIAHSSDIVDIGGSHDGETFHLGYPIQLTPARVDAHHFRDILYYTLRLSGVPCSVWVDLSIPETRRFVSYASSNNRDIPTSSHRHASHFAKTHIVIKSPTDEVAHRLLILLDLIKKQLP